MRAIDADKLRERMYHDAFEVDSDMQKWDAGCWIRYKMFENAIDDAPTVEPTEEQVKEYCRKRGLVIVNSELFNEMKARWSVEPVKHGEWIKNEGRYGWHCSECKEDNCYAYRWSSKNEKYELQDSYCPNCGVNMMEDEE